MAGGRKKVTCHLSPVAKYKESEMEISNINQIQSAAQGSVVRGQEAAVTPQLTHAAQNPMPEQININKLGDAVEKANDIAQLFYNTQLNFSVDETTNKLIVKVVDGSSGEVIRQIPPEEMLRLIAHFDKIQALLFSKKY